MWYKVDIKKLVIWLIPMELRKPYRIAYLFSLTKPISDILYIWQQMRSDNIYKLEHNGQVCYLRKALNDRFDPQKRRIIIVGAQRYKEQYIYTKGEKKPKYLGTMYLRRSTDFGDNGVDFLVLVPAELLDENNYEMKALIDYYKLASKR
ncbi:hypothetical protein Ga0061079_11729, partial [Apibacter mensalis]